MSDKPIRRTDTAESAPLLPCPFCGGEARYHIHDRFGIECVECGAGYAAVFTTKADVERAWNTRAERTCHMNLTDLCGAFYDVWLCSGCGEQVKRDTVMGKSEPPRYCPNCGARVEVGDA